MDVLLYYYPYKKLIFKRYYHPYKKNIPSIKYLTIRLISTNHTIVAKSTPTLG